MAEYFKLKIFYVPLIPNLFPESKTAQDYRQPVEYKFEQNHIPYLKEKQVNERLIFDKQGVKHKLLQRPTVIIEFWAGNKEKQRWAQWGEW